MHGMAEDVSDILNTTWPVACGELKPVRAFIDWCHRQFEDGELHVYDEGGKIFRTCGETMEDMLDELEVYLDECDGDPSTRSYVGCRDSSAFPLSILIGSVIYRDYGDCD